MQLYKNFRPYVSVILPTYNRENYLVRSIESVINQSFDDWELLIVDDGSSDGSFRVVDKYLKTNHNVRYLRHSNRGLPVSLNIGIAAGCGDYITFLGSDDEYKKDHLKLRFNTIEADKEIDLIHGGIEIVGNPYVKDKNDKSKEIHLNECIIGGTFFGKIEMFKDLKGFKDISYSEDSEFYSRAVKKFKCIKVNFPTYIYYRDTPDSICNNI